MTRPVRHAHTQSSWRTKADHELTEADWQSKVLYLAGLLRWQHFHPRVMRGSHGGWPDLALWHPGRGEFLLAELKTETGRLRRDQERVIAELRSCGLEVHVWRPRDWRAVAARFGAAA